MRLSVFLLIIYFLIGCNHPKEQEIENNSFREFDCTFFYAFGAGQYSLKFTDNDTVYLKNRFSPDSNITYFGVLNEGKRLWLDTLLNRLTFQTLDSKYDTHDNDGDELYLYIERDSFRKSTYLHGAGISENLYDLRAFLKETKATMIFHPILKKVSFLSYETYLDNVKKYSR